MSLRHTTTGTTVIGLCLLWLAAPCAAVTQIPQPLTLDAALSWAVVLTKSDKLKPTQIDKTVKDTHAKISCHVAAYPEIFITSSETKDGIENLRAQMAGLATPKSTHPINP